MSQPPPSEPSDTGPARLIDKVCDRFELAWRAGQGPRIEEYLDRAPAEAWRPLLRELLVSELELRAKAGDEAKLEEYLARFPDHAAIVREAFGTTPTIRHGATQDPAATHDHREQPAQPWAMQVRCPHCHNPIEIVETDSLREIKCPSCDSLFSLVGSEGQRADAAGKRIGHFELLELLGTGGFGTVFKARDTKLDRIVALKIPRRSQLDAEELEKFFREARAAAQLKHPNIVSVHEVGRDGETVYIVSDYIEGQPLDKWLEGQKVTPCEAAALCEKIARALHHAHEAGVVHRDLKPSNIILDAAGEPHVMDFGLAKREAGEITMTVDGQILGTPAYMSPEQARGESHKADRRTDVYSLGVVLYQMLTGELPFRGSMQMLLAQLLQDEPLPPRRLNNGIPRDMETIVLKCLAKRRFHRYANAEALAIDLRLFGAKRPIRAKRASRARRIWLWTLRNPIVGTLAAAIFLALLVGTAVGIWQSTRVSTIQKLAREQAKLAEERALMIDEEKRRNEAQTLKLRTTEYLHKIWSAQKALRECKPDLADEILNECPADLRDWEHPYLSGQVRQHLKVLEGNKGTVGCVAFSPDGRRVVAGNNDGALKVWDTETGSGVLALAGHEGPVASVTYTLDGERIISLAKKPRKSGEFSCLKIWDANRGRCILTLEGSCHEDFAGPIRRFNLVGKESKYLITPETKFFVSVGNQEASRNEVTVWNATSGQKALTFKESADVARAVISPDGRWIVSCFGELSDSTPIDINVRDVATGQVRLKFQGHFASVHNVEFSPDGRFVVSQDWHKATKVWDVNTGRESAVDLKTTRRSLAFSPDGSRLIVSVDGTLKVCDTIDGKVHQTLLERNTDGPVALSHDGRRLASFGGGALRVWDAKSGHCDLAILNGVHSYFDALAFSRNDRWIIGYSGGGFCVWDAFTGEVRAGGKWGGIEFSPIHQQMVEATEGTYKLWDLRAHEDAVFQANKMSVTEKFAFASLDGMLTESGKSISVGGTMAPALFTLTQEKAAFPLRGLPVETPATCMTVSPNAASVALSRDGKTLELWDLRSTQLLKKMAGHAGKVSIVAYSPDGRWLVSLGETAGGLHELLVWEAATGKQGLAVRPDEGVISVDKLAFSPDSRRLVAGGRIWDVESGQAVLEVGSNYNWRSLRFSPDGRWICRHLGSKTLAIYDAQTGQNIWTMECDDAFALSPVSKQIAATIRGNNKSRDLQLWDLATGQATVMLAPQVRELRDIGFSPDGERIVGLVRDMKHQMSVVVWNAKTGDEVMRLQNDDRLRNHEFPSERARVAFSQDGRLVVVVVVGSELSIFDAASGRRLFSAVDRGAFIRGRMFINHFMGTVAIDTITGQVGLQFYADQGNPYTDFSPNGRRMVSWGDIRAKSFQETNDVKIWDTATGQLVMDLGTVNDLGKDYLGNTDRSGGKISFSQDGSRIMWICRQDVRTWDAFPDSSDANKEKSTAK